MTRRRPPPTLDELEQKVAELELLVASDLPPIEHLGGTATDDPGWTSAGRHAYRLGQVQAQVSFVRAALDRAKGARR